ncbi:MAG TPA: response regulator transcription factor [Acidimicrobiales bacterium]
MNDLNAVQARELRIVEDVAAGPVSVRPLRVLLGLPDPWLASDMSDGLEANGVPVLAMVPTTKALLMAIDELRPECIVLDLGLPGSALRCLADLADAGAPPILALGSLDRELDVFSSLSAGAAGYLPTDVSPVGLAAAIRAVVAGEVAIPRRLIGMLVNELRGRGRHHTVHIPPNGERVSFTEREWEVLLLLHQGRTTSEIADRLFVSQATVRSHVATILHRLGVPDRSAARRAIGAF